MNLIDHLNSQKSDNDMFFDVLNLKVWERRYCFISEILDINNINTVKIVNHNS